jgi:hypothetical protein
MTNNTPGHNGLSMISMLAISAGLAAAPAHAQTVIAPSQMPMQSPVAVPQPTPAPTAESSPVTSRPTAQATTPATPDRADDLATRGGFDAATVAPEALAQIESEQQTRKAEAAEAAATKAAPARARTTSAPASAAADSGTDSMTMAAPVAATSGHVPAAGFDSLPPLIQPQAAPAAPETVPADLPGDADWNLLAALAALLGIGGAGAYAVSRRRKGHSDPESDPVTEATMPELRRNPLEEEQRSAATKADFAAFVGGLPPFEAPRSKADHHVKNAERRVAAASPPYLGEADLFRPNGYFMTHVDGIPTPQNPFLTRQKRLKRAQYLDAKLAEMKAAHAMNPTGITGTMQATRPLRAAYH